MNGKTIKDFKKTDKQAVSEFMTNQKLSQFGMTVCSKCGKVHPVDVKHECK